MVPASESPSRTELHERGVGRQPQGAHERRPDKEAIAPWRGMRRMDDSLLVLDEQSRAIAAADRPDGYVRQRGSRSFQAHRRGVRIDRYRRAVADAHANGSSSAFDHTAHPDHRFKSRASPDASGPPFHYCFRHAQMPARDDPLMIRQFAKVYGSSGLDLLNFAREPAKTVLEQLQSRISIHPEHTFHGDEMAWRLRMSESDALPTFPIRWARPRR